MAVYKVFKCSGPAKAKDWLEERFAGIASLKNNLVANFFTKERLEQISAELERLEQVSAELSKAKEWLEEQTAKFANINFDDEKFSQDDELAFVWITKAAEQGVAEAQYRLGQCYFEGKGVDKSDGLGRKWLEAAIENNHAEANAWLKKEILRFAFPNLSDKP